ncbi:MAG: AAA family ATPase [Candidatus Odinarchaeota archaeon]
MSRSKNTRQQIGKALSDCPFFQSASNLLNDREQLQRIRLQQIPSLDECLNGLELKSLHELFGDKKSGKSRLSQFLCVKAQLPVDQGGLLESEPVRAVYIDSGNNFIEKWIEQVCRGYGINAGDVRENIFLRKVKSAGELTQQVFKTAQEALALNIKLIVIDDITTHFQQKPVTKRIDQLLEYLKVTAEATGLAGVIVNDVKVKDAVIPEWIEKKSKITEVIDYEDLLSTGKRLYLNNIIAYACTDRLFLRSSSYSDRLKILHIAKSPVSDTREFVIEYTDCGIREYDS